MENSSHNPNSVFNSNCTNENDSYNLNQNNINGQQESSPRYSFPAILHYLQYQWQKFEQERLQWDIEKAEMKTQLRILEGRVMAQFNLKKDLIRRIKMLEFCLREERAKFHQLKYGIDPPVEKNEDLVEEDSSLEITNMSNWKQGRKLLRQYLMEIGYTGTIIDVRSNRVRYLLGLGNNEEIVNENNQNTNNNIDTNGLINKQSSLIQQITNKQNKKNTDQTIASNSLVADAEASVSATFEFLNEHSNSFKNIDRYDQNDDENEFDYEGIPELSILRPSNLHNNNNPINNKNNVPNTVLETKTNFDVVDIGELADITLNNDNYENEEINEKDITNANNEMIKVFWSPHYLLKSHFDCIRCLKFHPKEPLIVTGSEDETIKLWNLKKAQTNNTKKQTVTGTIDLEPIYTYRGHKSLVLTLIISGNKIFSGDLNGEILIWKIPKNFNTLDPYEPYDTSLSPETLSGHINAVWSLVMMPTKKIKNTLEMNSEITNASETNQNQDEKLNIDEKNEEEDYIMCSASADGTIKVWDTKLKLCLRTIVLPETNNRPTCLAVIPDDTVLSLSEKIKNTNLSPSYLVASFTNGFILIYDIDSSNFSIPVLVFETNDDTFRVNAIVVHPLFPVLVSAHENKLIKFWDCLTGKCFFSTIAHLDEVTCLDCDSKGLYLLSGGHDCSVRLWNFHTKKCIKEITSHRNKFSEALLCVSFHPTQEYFASGGADALAKIFS